MKKMYLILSVTLVFITTSCKKELEIGMTYPSLALKDTILTFKIDKVFQNNLNVKPYFDFFDNVKLSLTYKDGKPANFTFTEAGAPFRVTKIDYFKILECGWYIESSSSPYKIRIKGTDEVLCFMSRDRIITFPFKLGAPSNNYEYSLVKVNE